MYLFTDLFIYLIFILICQTNEITITVQSLLNYKNNIQDYNEDTNGEGN